VAIGGRGAYLACKIGTDFSEPGAPVEERSNQAQGNRDPFIAQTNRRTGAQDCGRDGSKVHVRCL